MAETLEDKRYPKPGATPTPTPSSSGNLGPSPEAEKAGDTSPQGSADTKKTGLTGVPVGTPIVKGQEQRPPTRGRGSKRIKKTYGATQYAPGDGARIFGTLNNQEKIDLIALLAQIPGLYNRKEAPTQEYLLRLVSAGGNIAVREEDMDALENVMRYADTTGDSYSDAVNKLVANPAVAQGFFDLAGTKVGAARKIALTPADALVVELQQSILDYLDIKASKSEAESYAKKINDLEKKRGGALTQLERQQLLLDEVQNKAKEVFKDGIDEADSLLMRKGALGGTYNALQQEYRDYGIPIDDKSLYKLAINSIRSKQALENNLGKIRLQAEVAMPALKDYIQQGLSPKEALGTYLAAYSRFTGIPQNQVDLTRLAPVYSGDKVMPFNDWEKYLYTLPEAKDSPVIREQQLSDARTLIRNFIG
jgi:hypothetical protein